MSKFYVILLVLAGFCFHNSHAQFILKAELRPRAEFRHGYKKLATDNAEPAFFISQRSRLMFYYQSKPVDIGFSIQDVRVWGDESLYTSTGVFGDHSSIDANEAWIGLKPFKDFYVKVGRQYFDYDSKHLLWERNWNQNSVSYDAILFQYSKPKTKIDLAFSLNNEGKILFNNYYESRKIKTLNFLHIERQLMKKLKGAMMLMAVGYTPKDNSNVIYTRGTYGLFLNYQARPLFGEVSAYYQSGKNRDGVNADAWFMYGKLGYQTERFKVFGSYTQISGNRVSTEKDELFDIFYGARHRYYGLMDYFSNIPVATDNGGLEDVMLSLNFLASQNISFSLDYHIFFLDESWVVPFEETVPVKISGPLGNEFDFHFSVDFREDINLKGGYSFMLPDEDFEAMQLGSLEPGFSYWGWLMLTVKPTLFSSE